MEKVKNVPVIMQMEMVECGAASLGMILAYHKKWLPLEQLRKDCGVSRDGCSAKQLLLAGRSYGMDANAYKLDEDELQEMAPVIIHWNFNHFVVYNGKKGNTHYLNDPAKGKVKVTQDEFNKSYTGIALAFEPTEAFQRGGSRPSIIGFVKRRLKNTWAAAFFIFVTGLLSAIVGITAPLFSQVFMDNILSGKNPDWFKPFMVAFLAVIGVNVLIEWLKGIYMRKYNAAMAIDANSNFFWHVLRLPMDFFSQRYVGDLILRQRSNQNIASVLVQQLAPLAIQMMLLVLYLTFMLRYSVLLTLIGLGAMGVNMLLVSYISTKRVDVSRISERDTGKYYGVTMSCLDNIETIKAAGAENGFFNHWAGYFTNMHNSEARSDRRNQLYGVWPEMLQALTNNAILLIGVYMIMDGEFTIGTLLAFQGFMSGFSAPVQQLIAATEMVIEMRTQMERVEDVLKYPVEQHEEVSRSEGSGKLKGRIELKNVSFGYNVFSQPQIKDFSMTVEPGKSIAFVGTSGCGKSTLAKLITGLYQPWKGEILFDGKRRNEINKDEFTNSVAMIDQNVVMFDDTIMANIKMWDSSIEDFAMLLACRDAQIREEVVVRPEGFNTRLMKGGKNFSGGQLQRIEIATALAREPVILIMDEATSALDAETEKRIMDSIRMMGVTLIVIAHRLSTIRDCDEIVVLEKGEVVERGTHQALIEKDGVYKQLVTCD